MKHNLDWLISRPIAHRGLHNAIDIFENTMSAAHSAVKYDYNIEMDMQPTFDFTPVIFHDLELDRMTHHQGNIRETTVDRLNQFNVGTSEDHISTLEEMLKLVSGKTGILLELKGLKDHDEGFAKAVVDCVKNYDGPIALMSFYHWLLQDVRKFAPDLPLGLTAMGDNKSYTAHKEIATECDVDFVSYKIDDLPCKFATEFRATGKPVLCWTVKTHEQASLARKFTDQMTFEGIDPDTLQDLH